MPIKILKTYWFSQMTSPFTIGIVKTKNEVGQIKFFIGTGLGYDDKKDAMHIAERGGHVYPNALAVWLTEE